MKISLLTTLSLSSFASCCWVHRRNPAKFYENSNL